MPSRLETDVMAVAAQPTTMRKNLVPVHPISIGISILDSVKIRLTNRLLSMMRSIVRKNVVGSVLDS